MLLIGDLLPGIVWRNQKHYNIPVRESHLKLKDTMFKDAFDASYIICMCNIVLQNIHALNDDNKCKVTCKHFSGRCDDYPLAKIYILWK